MARSFSRLTAEKLIREHKAAVASGQRSGTTKFSWGSGLVLAVGPTGNASWIARITAPNGKRRDIGLGRFDEVSIEEARVRVSEHKRIAREGDDPKAVKDAQRHAARNPVPTFEEAARAVHAERAGGFRNPKHRDQWLNSLRDHAFPVLGKIRVDEIEVPIVNKALKPIWRTKPETAGRVLQRIAAIIAWSVAHGHRDHELAVKALRMGLGDQFKKVQHHAAVSVEDAGTIFGKLAVNETMSARCLQFAILTAARSNEARGARWAEVDLEAKTWTVPAERMKGGEDHVVALSPAAIALIENAERIETKGGFVFPNYRGKPLSDAALSKVAKSISDGSTVHGWRSTFRDWAAERTNTQGEVVEAALSHAVTNRVEAAYRRTKYLEKRRPLMAAWGDFLTGATADVANLDEVRKMKESTG